MDTFFIDSLYSYINCTVYLTITYLLSAIEIIIINNAYKLMALNKLTEINVPLKIKVKQETYFKVFIYFKNISRRQKKIR